MAAAAASASTRIKDIEDYCKELPSKFEWRDLDISDKERPMIITMLAELSVASEITKDTVLELRRKYKANIKISHFTQVYLDECEAGRMTRSDILDNFLITSRCRGLSGVTVVTVFLSPTPDGQTFTCKWDCNYCPNEPGQPRSYLFSEPGVLRANQNGFDCVRQMRARLRSYTVNGHPTDKLEVLILGGTIHSYPDGYLDRFMRDIFYAANTYSERTPREPLSIEEEKTLNTDGVHRIIGITVETRPDCVNAAEIRKFRRWGVTRVQIGIQHTDDEILRGINRGCYHRHTVRANKMLRDAGFKVDMHLMPNLPGSTPEKDINMFDVVLSDLHPDQVKIYPCEVTPFTKILEDYKAGLYIPYNNDALVEVVVNWKTRVHPWIRNNRVIRDIPDSCVVAGVKSSSQRCEFQVEMQRRGLTCRCMRCREAGRYPDADPAIGEMKIRTYMVADGVEHFLSWESSDEKILFGFCRLRLVAAAGDSDLVFPELDGAAMVRELHVYGRTVAARGADRRGVGSVPVAQHTGIGRRLMTEAERIAREAGYVKISVISGVGVRRYYEEKLGYHLDAGAGEFMMKSLVDVVHVAPVASIPLVIPATAAIGIPVTSAITTFVALSDDATNIYTMTNQHITITMVFMLVILTLFQWGILDLMAAYQRAN